MQKHTILINSSFTSVTQTISSSLSNDNNYFVNEEGLDNTIVVDAYNVRGFLNDPRNQNLISGFQIYLTGNTIMNSDSTLSTFQPTPYFFEIYYNDNKLSNLFNSYYENSIQQGIPTPTYYISEQLTDSSTANTSSYTAVTNNNYFQWNYAGNMSTNYLNYIPSEMVNNIRQTTPPTPQNYQGYSLLDMPFSTPSVIPYSTDENYYIPVFLSRGINQLDRNIYDLSEMCEKILENATLSPISPTATTIPSTTITIISASAATQIMYVTLLEIAFGVYPNNGTAMIIPGVYMPLSDLANSLSAGVIIGSSSSGGTVILTVDPSNPMQQIVDAIQFCIEDYYPYFPFNMAQLSNFNAALQGNNIQTYSINIYNNQAIGPILNCFVDLNINYDCNSFWA